MEYNPYDLLQLAINGNPIDGRPTDFDGTLGENDLVKPTKVSTVCPDCGQGLEFDLDLPDPPFPIIEQSCYLCNEAPVDSPDPFVNPLETGRVSSHELDPLLHDPDEQVVGGETVADKIAGQDSEETLEEGSLEVPDELDEKEAQDAESLVEGREEPKEEPGKVFEQQPVAVQAIDGPLVPLEQAEGMGQEEDFDDDDLVEDE
jgi:hypothetical protein